MSTEIVTVDIGGTHARFAIAEVAAGRVVSLGPETTLHTKDHASFHLDRPPPGQSVAKHRVLEDRRDAPLVCFDQRSPARILQSH